MPHLLKPCSRSRYPSKEEFYEVTDVSMAKDKSLMKKQVPTHAVDGRARGSLAERCQIKEGEGYERPKERCGLGSGSKTPPVLLSFSLQAPGAKVSLKVEVLRLRL